MLRSIARLLAATLLLASLAAGSAAPVGAGGGCHGNDGTAHTEGDATVVKMASCSFSPTVVHVAVGIQVRFMNTAEVDHLVVGESQTWGTFDVVSPGKEMSRVFTVQGVYPFSCPLHPGMVGAVVVGDADAAAALPPAAAVGGSTNGAPPADAAAQAQAATATSPGLGLAAGVVGAIVLALAILGGVLVWRRQGARPSASPEA